MNNFYFSKLLMKEKTFNCYKNIFWVLPKNNILILENVNFLDYYLNNFLHVLSDVSNWSNLNLIHKNENKFKYLSL